MSVHTVDRDTSSQTTEEQKHLLVTGRQKVLTGF